MAELREVYEGNLKLVEGYGKRPGVLGVVEGAFFFANKASRNGRVYPFELWERAIKSDEVQRRLRDRLLIGTVGHDEVDLDTLIREQKVSHVVTDLKLLPDGTGVGVAEILDTPVGRILYSLFKSGSKLAVSSKAYGDFRGQTEEGLLEVDPDTFILDRFDFVVDPGFLDARPQLKRQYESVVGGADMEAKNDVIEVLKKEREMLQQSVNEAINVMKENAKLLKEKEELQSKLSEMKEKMKEIEKGASFKKLFSDKVGVDEARAERELDLILKEVERLGDILVTEYGANSSKLKGRTISEVLRKCISVLEDKVVHESEVNDDIMKRLREENIELMEENKRLNKRLKHLLDREEDNRELIDENDELREENERIRDLLYEARNKLNQFYKLGSPEL